MGLLVVGVQLGVGNDAIDLSTFRMFKYADITKKELMLSLKM